MAEDRNKIMAKDFKKDPDKAVKQHKELKDAKTIFDEIVKETKRVGLTNAQQAISNARAKDNIVKAIERGNIPTINKNRRDGMEMER